MLGEIKIHLHLDCVTVEYNESHIELY